jgi:hypothetical protein
MARLASTVLLPEGATRLKAGRGAMLGRLCRVLTSSLIIAAAKIENR